MATFPGDDAYIRRTCQRVGTKAVVFGRRRVVNRSRRRHSARIFVGDGHGGVHGRYAVPLSSNKAFAVPCPLVMLLVCPSTRTRCVLCFIFSALLLSLWRNDTHVFCFCNHSEPVHFSFFPPHTFCLYIFFQGVCGLPENKDTKRTLSLKLKRLVQLIQQSNHTVILTGAGISTSAGIPDFRGPNGIWTTESLQNNNKRKRSKAPPIALDDFAKAQPTLTHYAICKLVELGHVQYCITQNVDGLHRRSGLSRKHHAVLHGCVFTETCEACQTEHFRDYDVGGMSFQRTGRFCEQCGGALRDILLDWEDSLPERDFERATQQCRQADLVICLGTSLRIEPAGELPTFAKQFVICNLQETPYDDQATLIIRAPVDDIMREVMVLLGHADWNPPEREAQVERLWKPPVEEPKESEED